MAFLIWLLLTVIASIPVLSMLSTAGLLNILTGIIAVVVVGVFIGLWMLSGTGF